MNPRKTDTPNFIHVKRKERRIKSLALDHPECQLRPYGGSVGPWSWGLGSVHLIDPQSLRTSSVGTLGSRDSH